ncbi:MAG: DMT family transporter [Lachnospiraceae bacterium]|nr:DMT family transporter [Lachnospiraceae bacterium]
MNSKKRELTGIAILLLASLIWGAAFTAQSIGAEYVPPFTFLASRSWIGTAVLLPVLIWQSRKQRKNAAAQPSGSGISGKEMLTAGALCGFFLFAASAAQQIGIAYTTTAKSGFLTAMYVVIVPVIYCIFRRKSSLKIWISVLLAVTGLYLLCMTQSLNLGYGDLITLLCALLFSFQIICVSRYVGKIGAVRLTVCQFFFEAVFSTVIALLSEHPTKEGMISAAGAILYAGVMSSGAGYTLQTIGQARVNPAAASIAMAMESVFSALSGWVILGQALSGREILGCAVMLSAIILAELPAIPGRRTALHDGEMIRQ